MHEMLAEEIVDKHEASTNSGGQHQKPRTGQFVEQAEAASEAVACESCRGFDAAEVVSITVTSKP